MEMAILTRRQLHQLNRTMLGLGAPIVIDGAGYNKFDYNKMSDFADQDFEEFTDRQCWFIAMTLGHYKNTQLTDYKRNIEETIICYAPSESQHLIRVLGTDHNYVYVIWRCDQQTSNALKGHLDKSQYWWKKVDNNWILSINWNYLDEMCAEFVNLKLDVSELLRARHPVEQLSLFPK